jgi:hypothetical protein
LIRRLFTAKKRRARRKYRFFLRALFIFAVNKNFVNRYEQATRLGVIFRYTYALRAAIIYLIDEVLTIPLPAHLLSQLEARATAEGIDLLTLAGRALRREATRPLLNEILKPIRDAFAASGMTDDELAELLEVEKHAMRGVPHERE